MYKKYASISVLASSTVVLTFDFSVTLLYSLIWLIAIPFCTIFFIEKLNYTTIQYIYIHTIGT